MYLIVLPRLVDLVYVIDHEICQRQFYSQLVVLLLTAYLTVYLFRWQWAAAQLHLKLQTPEIVHSERD